MSDNHAPLDHNESPTEQLVAPEPLSIVLEGSDACLDSKAQRPSCDSEPPAPSRNFKSYQIFHVAHAHLRNMPAATSGNPSWSCHTAAGLARQVVKLQVQMHHGKDLIQ